MSQTLRWPSFFLLALLAGLIAAACLLPGLNGGFIFDDRGSIQLNPALHLAQLRGDVLLQAAYSFQPGNGSRALPMLTFALDYWRAGMDAQAFKTTNIAIHAWTALILAFFFRRLLLSANWEPKRAGSGALVLALLWALHPLQVSSVLYVVQRMQTLVTLFMIFALWAYVSMRQAQITGTRSRLHGVLALLFWVLGLACKEDAILLPAYTLALELTLFRFAAASPRLAQGLRKGYLVLVGTATLVFLLFVVPHYWHWDNYPLREFSSLERLLTQCRVLVMYIGQSLFPLPSHMPFYYDDLAISRGWLQPASTLLAGALLLGLLLWAWRWRTSRPLFSLGLLLFFAGHAITSNILNLEMAFEHRNHFPLIGLVLAAADLCLLGWQRLSLRPAWGAAILLALLFSEAGATAWRAHQWGEPLRFALAARTLAPHSERAWLALNAAYVDRSGFKADSPWLDRAIATCEEGAAETNSAVLLSNAVIYKTLRGDISAADWEKFHASLPQMPMNVQNTSIALILLSNVEKGVALDANGVTTTWEIMLRRTDFAPNDLLHMAAFIHNRTREPARAFPFMRRAVELSPPDDPAIAKLMQDLESVDRQDWARTLSAIHAKVPHSPAPPQKP